jgi:hypothetical protein
MKNNIGFFTHETDALDNRKFLILRTYYGGVLGWAMEARFWALNCLIGKADGCKLDSTKKGERARIARALDLSLAELDAFLVVLRDEAELLHDDAGILWTEQTQEDLGRAVAARTDAKSRREGKKKGALVDEGKASADDGRELPDKTHGAEQSGLEGNNTAAAARDELSTGEEAGPKTPQEADEFAAWALERAREMPGVKWPAKYAKRIIADPQRFEEFKASRPPPPAPSYPAPGDCPNCGGDMLRHPGQEPTERRCTRCGCEIEYRDPGGWTAKTRAGNRTEEAVG